MESEGGICMQRLLLVEDDVNLASQMKKELENEKFAVDLASSLAEAEAALALQPQLVLLDWQLPDGTGYDLMRRWRNRGVTIPIIFLTARTDVLDKVVGLEGGADDYLTKPVELRELFARIRVRLRPKNSGNESEADILRVAGIELNSITREVQWRGKQVSLTKLEFELLRFLMQQPNRVFSRDELLNKIWGFERYPSTRTVDTHVAKLRSVLSEDLIESIRGVGYRFKA